MAGLEVLYSCVSSGISCPQDAVVCFIHWEMIQSGYRCIGSGDEVSSCVTLYLVTVLADDRHVAVPPQKRAVVGSSFLKIHTYLCLVS